MRGSGRHWHDGLALGVVGRAITRALECWGKMVGWTAAVGRALVIPFQLFIYFPNFQILSKLHSMKWVLPELQKFPKFARC
jgi:hypothetical protein